MDSASSRCAGQKLLKDVSFCVKKGEILGIAGLMGAGRTELMMSLIGEYGCNITGEIKIDGEKVAIKIVRRCHSLWYWLCVRG